MSEPFNPYPALCNISRSGVVQLLTSMLIESLDLAAVKKPNEACAVRFPGQPEDRAMILNQLGIFGWKSADANLVLASLLMAPCWCPLATTGAAGRM